MRVSFPPSVTGGRGIRGENLGFPVCVACSPWRHGQEGVASGVSAFDQKKAGETRRKRGCHTSFLKVPQPMTGELGCVRLGPRRTCFR